MTPVNHPLETALHQLLGSAPAAESPTSIAPISELAATVSPSIGLLRDFLFHNHPDVTGGLLRRADFFAPRLAAGSAKDLPMIMEGSQAEALQSCSGVTISGSGAFGDVRVNTSTTRYFTINNPNCCSVNYTIAGPGYGFSLSTSGGTIPANGSVSISVTFTPYNAQYYNGSFSITPGGASISLSGRGIN